MHDLPTTRKPIIVTALEYERRALRRRGLDSRAELECCGPGATGVETWAARTQPGHRLVILCGLSAGLTTEIDPGEAKLIDEVIDATDGRKWSSEIAATAARRCELRCVRAGGCDEILTDPASKTALHQRTGALVADMESAAFARIAEANRWRWAVIRGVSDGVNDQMPRESIDWINSNGRLKPLAIAWSLVQRPPLAKSMLRLSRSSNDAMTRIAEIARKLIDCETNSTGGAD